MHKFRKNQVDMALDARMPAFIESIGGTVQ
jgi:hypothetical protein